MEDESLIMRADEPKSGNTIGKSIAVLEICIVLSI